MAVLRRRAQLPGRVWAPGPPQSLEVGLREGSGPAGCQAAARLHVPWVRVTTV